jgi:multidrug efflux pump
MLTYCLVCCESVSPTRVYAFLFGGFFMEETNIIGTQPIKKVIWKMGIPMIISMILQAIYNIVDTAFVINMGEDGVNGNLALTYAFPIQLLIIAIGVGTGVGINTLLSKCLGEKNMEKANKVVGNGIFLSFIIYLVFLIFGLFLAKPFISMQASGNQKVIEMGTSYLMICCTLSFGAVFFTVYERFLQAVGKAIYSTIAQISGALLNIILDYVFIYPLNGGIAGAAYATIIGQIVSLLLAMYFHYFKCKIIDNKIRYLKPDFYIIKEIYKIGLSAAIMQGLLSVMMLGVNLILGFVGKNSDLLLGSFGIYYKIQQFALFAAFGLSNTIISVLAFNYGMKDNARILDSIKFGILDTLLVTLIITILFELFADNLATIFGLASGSNGSSIIKTCATAIRIGAIGFVFMGISVAIQGVFQALNESIKPMFIALLRLVIFLFPFVYIFTLNKDYNTRLIWLAFPLSELLTSIIAVILLIKELKKRDIIYSFKNLLINRTYKND